MKLEDTRLTLACWMGPNKRIDLVLPTCERRCPLGHVRSPPAPPQLSPVHHFVITMLTIFLPKTFNPFCPPFGNFCPLPHHEILQVRDHGSLHSYCDIIHEHFVPSPFATCLVKERSDPTLYRSLKCSLWW